jgi:long-chain acyl-CoA synthetase
MFFQRFKKFSSKTALVDIKGKKIPYRSFLNNAKKLNKIFEKEKFLVFLEADHNPEFYFLYTYFIEKKKTLLIFEKDLDFKKFKNLKKKYQPAYIIRLKSVKNCNNNILLKSYFLYKNKKGKRYPIHSDLAILLPTSGTTGSPKYNRCSYKNLLFNTQSIIKYLKLKKSHTTISSLPISYVYGLSVYTTHLFAGGTIVLTNMSIVNKEFWKKFNKFSCNNLNLVPTMYEIITKLKIYRLLNNKLQFYTSAGDKMSEYLLDFIRKNFPKNSKLFRMYGQSEATSRICYIPPRHSKQKNSNCIGQSIPGGKIILKKIRNNKFKKIFYYGPNVTMGYSSSCEDLVKKDQNNGLLDTKDIGYKGEDGYFYIVGRDSRFVKINALRFNLDEIEDILNKKFKSKFYITPDNNKIYVTMTNRISKNKINNFFIKNLKLNIKNFTLKKVNQIPLNSNGKVNYKILMEKIKNDKKIN